MQKITQRILTGGPERYAVSAQEDSSVWRQAVEQGEHVYSVELVLSGALHQTLDLESFQLSLDE